MKIGIKITIGFLAVVAIFAIFGYSIYLNEKSIEVVTSHFSDEIVIELNTLQELKSSSLTVLSTTMEIVLIMDERNFIEQQQQQQIENELKIEEKEILQGKRNFENAFDVLYDLAHDDPFEADSTNKIKEKWNIFLSLSEELIKAKESGISGIEILELKEEFEVAETNLLKLIDDALEHEFDEVIAVGGIIDSSFSTNFQLILWGIVFVVIASIIIGLGISNSISKPITKLKRVANDLNKGLFDTKIVIESNDEIGEFSKAFDSVADTMKKNQELIKKQLVKLQTIDKQKEEFAAMISHELKTPLVPIKFLCEMLTEGSVFGKLTTKQLGSIDEIDRNATRLERLISDILDAQKLDMKKLIFNLEKFNLAEFMERMESDLSPLMKNKAIEFEIKKADSVELESDEYRIHQVIDNLVRNAVDFVPEKTGKIEIGSQIKDGKVEFYVKDNGIGIAKDMHSKLFKKFYQVDTSPTRSHGGTGLGLVICKGLIEGLGGKIWLDSEEGEGSTFYFSIPAATQK